MQAYKYNTQISEQGIISLPYEPALFNRKVEIIIFPKSERKARKETEKKYTAKDFIVEFSGCLKNLPEEDSNDLKYEYIKRKHQLFSDNVSEEKINEARNKYLTEKYK